MWLFTQGESWSELSSVASLTCFSVRRSKLQVILSSGDGEWGQL